MELSRNSYAKGSIRGSAAMLGRGDYEDSIYSPGFSKMTGSPAPAISKRLERF